MRYAICNELFEGWDFGRTCDFVARTGYDGIEIAPFTLAAEGVNALDGHARATLRQQARDAGLTIVGLHWLLVGPSQMHLTSPAAAIRHRTGQYLTALVECCADLGGGVLVLGSPKQRLLAPGTDAEAGRALAADSLTPAVRRAAELGVRWCLEPLPATDTNFMNTLDDALQLDRVLGQGTALGVQLDAKSLCAEAPEPSQPATVILAHAADATRFGHFHANDRNMGGPGTGDVAFRPIFEALGHVGYDGWMSVEVFDFAAGAERIAVDSLRYLRETAVQT